MDGQLAQLIALAAHGRTWLARPETSPPPDLACNSTFQYVRTLQFNHPKGRPLSRRLVSLDVQDWLSGLKAAGAQEIWLAAPDMTRSPSSGSSAIGAWWALLAEGRKCNQEWQAHWAIHDEEPPAPGRIWSVTYDSTTKDVGAPQQPEIQSAKQQLTGALKDCREVARDVSGLSGWAQWFGEAIHAEPPLAYHPDLLTSTARCRRQSAVPIENPQAVQRAGVGEVGRRHRRVRSAQPRRRVSM